MAVDTRGLGFATQDEGMSVTLEEGRRRFWSDGSGYSTYGRRIYSDDYPVPPSC